MEDKKTSREKQMFITHMDPDATKRVCGEHKNQREQHHQDLMMMVVVTGVKSLAPTSSYSSGF
eukprot:4633713-Ditylum_brightwellii.AAC.1